MIRSITFMFAFAFLGACAASNTTTVLPPPEDQRGDWFCCDAAGNCVHAKSACGPKEVLVWCKVVETDPKSGLKVCKD